MTDTRCHCHELTIEEGECDVCAKWRADYEAQPLFTSLRAIGSPKEWAGDAIGFACLCAFLACLPFTIATARAICWLALEGKLL